MWTDACNGEWDYISTRRIERTGEPLLRSASARLFYRLINRLSDADIADGARDFRLMDCQFVNAVLSLNLC